MKNVTSLHHYFGTYAAKIDNKRRVSIPAAFRKVMPDNHALFIVPEQESRTLYIRPTEMVFTDISSIENTAPFIEPMPTLDSTGRIVLKTIFMDLCGFNENQKIFISGHGAYFAMRSEEAWEARKRELMVLKR